MTFRSFFRLDNMLCSLDPVSRSNRSIMPEPMIRIVAVPSKGIDVIPPAPSHKIRLLHQLWKFWLLGLMFTIGGLLQFGNMTIGAYFGVLPPLVSLGGTVIVLAALLTGCLVLRCPQCHLSLLWHAVSKKTPGAWLGWLLGVRTCPRCALDERVEHIEPG